MFPGEGSQGKKNTKEEKLSQTYLSQTAEYFPQFVMNLYDSF